MGEIDGSSVVGNTLLLLSGDLDLGDLVVNPESGHAETVGEPIGDGELIEACALRLCPFVAFLDTFGISRPTSSF